MTAYFELRNELAANKTAGTGDQYVHVITERGNGPRYTSSPTLELVNEASAEVVDESISIIISYG